jgi:hypothetical protein
VESCLQCLLIGGKEVFDIDTAQIQHGENHDKIQIRLVLSPSDPS